MAKQTNIQEFEAVFPKLEKALLEHAEQYKLPKQAVDWYKKVGGPYCCCWKETIMFR